MKRNRLTKIVPALVAAALLATACGSDDDVNDVDVEFAQGMIPHHVQAIDMAQLVVDRTSTPEIIELAGQIEAAQDPEIQVMVGWLEEWGEDVPDTSGADDDGHGGHGDHGASGMMTDEQMAELESATGEMFDRMFLEMMIEHHEGAIVMAEIQLADGADEDVKEMAQEIIDVQRAEIDHMRDLLDTSGN
jgi:uncharacterized protein (DUF305 family)